MTTFLAALGLALSLAIGTLPSMSDSPLHSATSSVTIQQAEPSYPIDLPLDDPRCGNDPTTTSCTDYGPDPDPPDPLWTEPPGWAECWPGYWAICEETP
jgi:hypothetical protein